MARGFNAARGFVDGATKTVRRVTPCRICFNAARGFVGGATAENASDRHDLLGFNAARGFVGGATTCIVLKERSVQSFNAARGFVGGAASVTLLQGEAGEKFQCRTRLCGWCSKHVRHFYVCDNSVSMPHAALWVVQLVIALSSPVVVLFQCRTRLCGWCSFVARSPCPPRGKKPFWKVSGNLSVLTENM